MEILDDYINLKLVNNTTGLEIELEGDEYDDFIILGHTPIEQFKIDRGNNKILPKSIRILYDYPLKYPEIIKHYSKDGFSKLDIMVLVSDDYRNIYKEEREDIGETPNESGMLNKKNSHGRHGIWGHSIGELILHSIRYNKTKKYYELGIDS